VEVVATLEALDRALGPGAEDAVGMQVQRALQDPHRRVVIAGVQGAPGARGGGQRKRDEQRDEKMS
jgi:hypothetical protein